MKEDSTYHYYETHAADYFRSTYRLDLSHLWTILEEKLLPGALVLDLGCGSGRDLLHFSQAGFRVVGIDYSFNLLRLATEFSRQPVVLGDIQCLPFKAHTFDAVWAIGSLLHIRRRAISPVLSQIHKILKPGALLLTSMKKGDGESIDPSGRYTAFYQPQEWVILLKESSFKVGQLGETIERRKTEPGGEKIIDWISCLAFAEMEERSHPTQRRTAGTVR